MDNNGNMNEKLSEKPRLTLTISEAAKYSGIGINKLRRMAHEPDCPFAMYIGSRCVIKREAFEEFIKTAGKI